MISWLKSSQADQDALMECDQIIYSPPRSPHTSSIDVAVLGYHWVKSSTAGMISSYELFNLPPPHRGKHEIDVLKER